MHFLSFLGIYQGTLSLVSDQRKVFASFRFWVVNNFRSEAQNFSIFSLITRPVWEWLSRCCHTLAPMGDGTRHQHVSTVCRCCLRWTCEILFSWRQFSPPDRLLLLHNNEGFTFSFSMTLSLCLFLPFSLSLSLTEWRWINWWLRASSFITAVP